MEAHIIDMRLIRLANHIKKSPPRKLGAFKGKIKIPDDFDEPMPKEWFEFNDPNDSVL